MYQGDVPRDPLDRVDSEESPFYSRRQLHPDNSFEESSLRRQIRPDNSFTNLQLLDQEEDICIPDAKISTCEIKQVKTSSLNPHRHCHYGCVAGD